MLARSLKKVTMNKLVAARSFGAVKGPWYRDQASNGLAPVPKQPNGHDEHVHHPVNAADGERKFIAPCNKKTLVFDGLKGTTNAEVALDNQFHHLNGLSMFHHEYIFSPYSHANLIVNEANTHDEPYGYELGDDPFDAQGHGDMPYLMIFIGSVAFITTMAFHFRFDKRKTSEVFYHQRLTALQIEDELVAMRR